MIKVESLEEQDKYPYVGQYITENGKYRTVVFFTAPKEGFCLDSTDKGNLEDRYSYTWKEESFERCKVTIQ